MSKLKRAGIGAGVLAHLALILYVVFGGTPSVPHRMAAPDTVAHSDGLSDTESGYRFEPITMPEQRGDAVPVAFRIMNPGGVAETRFLDDQGKQLHFFVVRDDMQAQQHLHPELDGDTWRVTIRVPDGGAYRMFAEFIPRDNGDPLHPVVLGVPFAIAGDTELVPVPAPEATVDTGSGFTVSRVDGTADLPVRKQTVVRLKLSTSDGKPVEKLEPYLNANGHLTGFHTVLLSTTHLHPIEPVGVPLINGELTFQALFGERGEYRMFLEFVSGGRTHTAAFTVFVS
ncbi:hypothetical protein D5S17_28470 [Pseudonocardiaceae bacterium YIM PH 21723]|nr:hypothetical protein D5S17_28470 [Pseudonocardiaceae bacterium YIM PH 21723]